MAEFPHPVRLLTQLAWWAGRSAESALLRFEAYVREQYRRQGPRDN